jgi:Uma2 family endonuclease
VSDTAHLVTAEELEKFPDDDYRYELVQGRVIRMSPTGAVHGWLVMHFGSALTQHVQATGSGLVFTELGFRLSSSPDTVRAPDLAFIRGERLPETGLPPGFWPGPPDLAIEVLSPDDRPADIRAKVAEYLAYGVPLVVVIDPDERMVITHRSSALSATLGTADILDLNDVVLGFRCKVQDIFAR